MSLKSSTALAVALLWASFASAQIPISALPAAGTLNGSEAVPADQAGTTVAATVNQIRVYTLSNIPPINLAGTGSGGVTGILPVGSGGTGAVSLTGLLRGNGTSPFTQATAADVLGLWTGCSSPSTMFMRADGTCQVPTFNGVTSVSLAAPSSLFVVSGSPGTGSASLTLAFQPTLPANEFLGTPNGSTGTPSLRALLGQDIPAINLAGNGNGGATGTLPVARGGTGATSLTGLLVGNGTGAFGAASASTVLGLWNGCTSPTTMFLRADGNCAAVAGGGSLTNVAFSAPSVFAVTGSPLSGSGGTIALSFASGQPANQVLATTSGGSGPLSLRALVPGDIPAINLSAAGNGGVVGNLPVTSLNSGAGASSATVWRGDGVWGGISASSVSGLAASATTDTTNAGNISLGTLALARLPAIPTSQISGLAASATTDTTNAGNISLGTLALARLPAIPTSQISGLAASATTDATNANNITSGTLGSSILPNSGVAAGSYNSANITVDAKGRLTAASSGASGAGKTASGVFTIGSGTCSVFLNLGGIAGCSFSATGDAVITFTTSFFTSGAVCVGNDSPADSPPLHVQPQLGSVTSQVQVLLRNPSGALVNSSFSLICVGS